MSEAVYLKEAGDARPKEIPDLTNGPVRHTQIQIAVVSGKGGSGKTMVAAALMLAFDRNDERVLLVDGDLGTGGLTYFLGLHNVSGVSGGITELLLEQNSGSVRRRLSQASRQSPRKPTAEKAWEISDFVRPIANTQSKLLPIGDHGRIFDADPATYRDNIGRILRDIRQLKSDIVIVDCRGGIDPDSLAVCQEVDCIIIIVETDGASLKTTQYLVDVLSRERLIGKIKGFLINKAISEPSPHAQLGTTLFRTSYLGAIPFDFETTRRFIYGDIPRVGGNICNSCGACGAKSLPRIN